MCTKMCASDEREKERKREREREREREKRAAGDKRDYKNQVYGNGVGVWFCT